MEISAILPSPVGKVSCTKCCKKQAADNTLIHSITQQINPRTTMEEGQRSPAKTYRPFLSGQD